MKTHLLRLFLTWMSVGAAPAVGAIDAEKPSGVATGDPGPTAERSVVPHTVPPEFRSTERFTVSVNGVPIPVMHAGLNVFFASFDFTGAADVQVTAAEVNQSLYNLWKGGSLPDEPAVNKNYWKGGAVVRPLSRGITAKTTGSVARLTITRPGQYSVEAPGLARHTDEVLFLFANSPESNRPVEGDPGVIYLGAGVHERSIDLKSGQMLYLDRGAVLYGCINVWDAEGVTIAGRGVIVFDRPMSKDTDNGPPNRPNQHPLTTHHVKGLTLSGVTVVNLRRTWSIQLHTTIALRIDNVKILALNASNANGDGIDWLDGGDATVRNSLIRSADDCFAFFAGSSVSAGGWVQPGPGASIRGTVSNVTIEDCVLWSTYANVLRIGWVHQALSTDHVTMRNCDIVHVSQNSASPVKSWSLLATSPAGEAVSNHSNYLLTDLRFENSFGLVDLQAKSAALKDFTFRNITMTGNPRAHYRGGLNFRTAERIHFDHVLLNGKAIDALNDL